MDFDLLADSRLVVDHEIKLYIELEVVEVVDASAAAGRVTLQGPEVDLEAISWGGTQSTCWNHYARGT
jgi:hypothetical protein